MNIIVAVDQNWAIGNKGDLLVRIPNDHKHFREETTGRVVVLGRKTLETFPQGMPLKNRTNIILTHDSKYQVKDALIVHSVEELMERLDKGESVQELLPELTHWRDDRALDRDDQRLVRNLLLTVENR